MSHDKRASGPPSGHPAGPPDGPPDGAPRGPEGSEPTREERALWRRVGPAITGGADACPTDLELAAHVDGRDQPDERRRIESHVAACPACLAAVDEVRGLLADETAVLVPGAVIEAARALVPAAIGATAGPRSGTRDESGWRLRMGVRVGVRWGAAVAASVVVAVGGFHAGSRVTEADQSLADVIASELSFGLEAETGGSDLEFALLSLAATGSTAETNKGVTP